MEEVVKVLNHKIFSAAKGTSRVPRLAGMDHPDYIAADL